MQELARQTGGLAFTNRNDLDQAVKLSVADGASYYLLGFYRKDRRWDRAFHRIQVTVNRSGIEVRHRQGYFALDPVEMRKEIEGSGDAYLMEALKLASPTSAMIVFDVRVVPRALGMGSEVPVEIMVDPHTLSSQGTLEGGRHFELSFHVAAYNLAGDLISHKDASVDAPLSAESYSGIVQQGFPLHMQLELSPGRYVLRVAVRDLRNGFIGTVDAPLNLE